eukprot:TRINITY_DN3099_c0_g1_i3.p1 TRINITY_DN3099_c0_g1~~TRINITY_DN3099_c0_g1_i3.p1  ORF type:complete len:1200 (+),score=287.12 TRINITY_DN3099_c0_g1_i3:441-4040(+)
MLLEYEQAAWEYHTKQAELLSRFEPPKGRLPLDYLFAPAANPNSYKPPIVPIDADDLIPTYRLVKERRRHNQTNRCIRIFISSTFKDMSAERELLVKQVIPELQQMANERGVTLSEVDLRWGITSEETNQGNTIKICLSEIDRCRPYFLCLLGERYGWHQTPGTPDLLLQKTFSRASFEFPWIDKFRDASVTELEVRHAALNNVPESDRMHALFYFRDQSYAAGRGTDFAAESSAAAARLGALKAEILQRQLHEKDYTTPLEAATLIKADLEALLNKEFPTSAAPPTALDSERAVHEALADGRTRSFIGADAAMQQLTLHTDCAFTSTADHPLPLLVTGDAGTGKTSLLANFASQFAATHEAQPVVAHFVGSSAASLEVPRTLLRIIEEIAELYGIQSEVPSGAAEIVTAFPRWLADAGQRSGLLLLIDGIDQFTDHASQELAWLPPQMPPCVQLVVSCRISSECAAVARARDWKEVHVEPLTSEDVAKLAVSVLGQYRKRLTDAQLQLLTHTRCCTVPLYLNTILNELRVFGEFEKVTRVLESCLRADTVSALLALILARVERDLGETDDPLIAGRTLCLICASRRGLTEDEIAGALGLSRALFAPPLHALLQAGLLLPPRAGDGLLCLARDAETREAVRARYLGDGIEQYREALARYFHRAPMPEHACEEVAYQYFAGHRITELAGLITDPAVFSVLASSQHRFDLLKYWKEAAVHERLDRMLLEAITKCPEKFTVTSCRKLLDGCRFLQDVAAYDAAERVCEMALGGVLNLGSSSELRLLSAECDDCLGNLFKLQGKFTEALHSFERAVATREVLLGPCSFVLAESLNNVANVYRKMGKYTEAEPRYLRACTLREMAHGKGHISVADSYDSIGSLYQDQCKNALAEQFFSDALATRQSLLGTRHPDVAMTLTHMASLYVDLSKYDTAETLLNRALEIYNTLFGACHPDVARTRNLLGGVCMERGQYAAAEEHYHAALAVRERILGPGHPDVALTLNDLAVLRSRQGDGAAAEQLYRRALDARKHTFGSRHPDTAQSQNNLAALLAEKGALAEADALLAGSLATFVSLFGPDHINVAQTLNLLASVRQRQGAPACAVLPLYRRSLAALSRCVGLAHPDVALTLNDAALLHAQHGRWTEAERLYRRALAVTCEVFRDEANPDVARQRANLCAFYAAWLEAEDGASELAQQIRSKMCAV